MNEIRMLSGNVVKVSDEDFDALKEYEWREFGRYAGRIVQVNAMRNFVIYMHRQIMEHPEGLVIDHLNGDGLDNRRSNLRIATRSQNQFNRVSNKNSESRFKGVTRKGDKWRAQIKVNGRNVHLGCFDSEEEAARVYDKAAQEHHREFARLNFPSPN
jgi:hypothetical protein